jgi:hypothetical protein
MKDLHHNLTFTTAIGAQAFSGDTPLVSAIIDRDGYAGVEFLIQTGSIGDANATFAVLLEDADEVGFNVTNAAVADVNLLGTEAGAGTAFTYAHDNATRKLGYIGGKRFLRLTITPSGNSETPSAAYASATAILGLPHLSPVA